MLITPPCVVTLTWRLQDAQGNLIDELAEPLEFFYGGDDLLEKVEEALLGQDTGFTTVLHLEPEHAFGDYDPSLVFFESRSILPEGVEVGMQFDGPPPGAATPDMPSDAIYTVTEVYPEHVVLDGNHPLAGMALRLDLQVRDVRAATEDEIEGGTVGSSAFTVLNTAPAGPQLH
ncbi:peptidylprolyl isomerase [uncultured Piscinibacter sp.]|uniref:FKBP-type peptidyl-prolyl cis-trans isomerase n=1 Tax=uncultured Piscinibacter sp. TaxID=1131835 RepID=UPI00262D75DC|nr:peptidylprolyl isomerase [uncultured Piscinibacter sp.]